MSMEMAKRIELEKRGRKPSEVSLFIILFVSSVVIGCVASVYIHGQGTCASLGQEGM